MTCLWVFIIASAMLVLAGVERGYGYGGAALAAKNAGSSSSGELAQNGRGVKRATQRTGEFLCLSRTTPPNGCALARPAARSRVLCASKFEIKEFPRNLRTDLKGASIRYAVEENAPDREWNGALMAKFSELTGIDVQMVRFGNDTSAALP